MIPIDEVAKSLLNEPLSMWQRAEGSGVMKYRGTKGDFTFELGQDYFGAGAHIKRHLRVKIGDKVLLEGDGYGPAGSRDYGDNIFNLVEKVDEYHLSLSRLKAEEKRDAEIGSSLRALAQTLGITKRS